MRNQYKILSEKYVQEVVKAAKEEAMLNSLQFLVADPNVKMDVKTRDKLTKAVEKILYPLWDSGYSVDHSVRTRSEVKEIADTDGRVALGLLDIRWVAGNRDLVDTVETVALMDWRKNGARWINELRKYSQERSQRFGRTCLSSRTRFERIARRLTGYHCFTWNCKD